VQVSLAQVRATYKQRDAWWTVLLVDPLASRLVRIAAPTGWITPTRLTLTAFLLGIAAGAAFLVGSAGWLIAGAALYHAGFVIDCMDGKLARLRGAESVFGSWLDFLLDRVRVFLCIVALFGGQFRQTGNALFLLVATGAVFLALFGYLNGAETDKASARIRELTGGGRPAGASFWAASEPVERLRSALHRRRIRVNLVSGVEFEMGMLVVAPLAAALWQPEAAIWVVLVFGALLTGFELALMARFGFTARSFDRRRQAVSVPTQRTGRSAADERAGRPA
jgi:phosphatidylglycerophosphate synthase